MNDFQDFLNTLTPEQLRQLADMKEGADSKPQSKKRKQKRKKLILPDDKPQPASNQPIRKTRNKQKRKPKSTLDKLLGQKGAPCRRLGPTELGTRPNRFEDGDIADIKDSCQADFELDKLLSKNRKPAPRLKPERQPQFLDAECSICEDEFGNVPAYACYKDGGKYIFTCDECARGRGNQ